MSYTVPVDITLSMSIRIGNALIEQSKLLTVVVGYPLTPLVVPFWAPKSAHTRLILLDSLIPVTLAPVSTE